ncbi:MAG TPA: hypothetical protein VMW16_08880 [Sedimentisphaerales bacterium]|nr:hypothetical protein [Sedimentisphaerales bacterium]
MQKIFTVIVCEAISRPSINYQLSIKTPHPYAQPFTCFLVLMLCHPVRQVYERCEYDAYGEPTIHTGKGNDGIWLTADDVIGTSSAQGNFYLFTGRPVVILDSGSLKIQCRRNCYYDYYTGRWLTRDTVSDADIRATYFFAALPHPAFYA